MIVCSHAREVKTGFPHLTGDIARLNCLILLLEFLVPRTIEYKIVLLLVKMLYKPVLMQVVPAYIAFSH